MDNKLILNISVKEMNNKIIEKIKENIAHLQPWIEIENTDNDDEIYRQYQLTSEAETFPDYSEDKSILFNNTIIKKKYLLTLYFNKEPKMMYMEQEFENIFYSKDGKNKRDSEDIKNRLIKQLSQEYDNFYDICDVISIEDIEDDFEARVAHSRDFSRE